MRKVLFTLVAISYCVWGYSQNDNEELLTRSDSLYREALANGKTDKAEAIRLAGEAVTLRQEALEVTDTGCASIMQSMVMWYGAQGDMSNALTLENQVLDIRRRELGENSPAYIDALYTLHSILAVSKEYQSALTTLQNVLSLMEQNHDTVSTKYIDVSRRAGIMSYQLSNYPLAVYYLEKAIKTEERLGANSSADAASDLILTAGIMYKIDIHKSISYYERGLPLYASTMGKDKKYYGNLYILGIAYDDAGKYQLAINTMSEALNEGGDYLSPFIKAELYNNIANSYALMHNPAEAIKNSLMAAEGMKQIFGRNSEKYSSALRNLSSHLDDAGKYQEALDTCMQSLKILYGMVDADSVDLSRCLTIIADIHRHLGENGKAAEYYEKALAIVPKESAMYDVVLNNASIFYSNINNYDEALRLSSELLSFLTSKGDTTSHNFCSALHTHANNLNELSRTFEARATSRKQIVIAQSKGNEYDYERVSALMGIAESYLQEARVYESDKRDTRLVLDSAMRYILLIENDSSLYQQASQILIGYKADICLLRGDYKEGIKYAKERFSAIDPKQQSTPQYLNVLYTIMLFEHHLDDAKAYGENMIRYTKGATDYLCSLMKSVSAYERDLAWEEYRTKFEKRLPEAVYSYPIDSVVISGMNGALFSKGLLLNAESSIKDLILQSGDSATIKAFDTLNMLRLQIKDLYGLEPEQQYCPVDSLEREADALERRLIRQSKVYGDFTHNLTIDWKEVQGKLKKNEAAVEFVNFAEYDSIYYAAYVVRKGDKTPRWVSFDPRAKTEKLNNSTVYTSSTMSQWLWGKLAKELNGVKTVYFAPSGELYNIGIEYMPDYADSTRRIGDRWTLHRLSSTRDLALNKEKYSRGSSAVYGGLQYDADKQVLQRDSKRRPNRPRDWEPFNIADTLASRGGADYLPGTRMEAIGIDSTLRTAHFENQLFTDTLGTEASFKALDGQRKSLLHISTHGFYWDPEEADLRNDYIKTIDFGLGDGKVRYTEDKALTRSGLLMAGANNALKGGIMPDSVDDGILTAKEIAELDLRGLDMVVLSACQTGLGDVSGEGVFGLQRGFKKAGAQSILMSLWKVDDRATQLLMTRFYHNWMSGMSKKKALTEAQEYLRNYMETRTEAEEATDDGLALEDNRRYKTVTVKPYTSPRYWAAFILLDALD